MNRAAATNRPVTIFRRAREILADEGPRSLWFKILGETVYRRVNIFEKDLDHRVQEAREAGGLKVETLSVEGVGEFLEFRSYAPFETVLERLAQGQLCYLVRSNGVIIHCCWSATGKARIDYLDCEVRLGPDVVYVYEAYTAPAFRRRDVSALRSGFMQRHYRDNGYRRYVSVSWPENLPAHQAIFSVGCRITGRLGYWGFGRFKRYFCNYDGDDAPFVLQSTESEYAGMRSEPHWERVPLGLDNRQHYLDPFLAHLKRRENRRLVLEWGDLGPGSRVLKTDAFEEAMGADSFLPDLQQHARWVTGIDVSSEIVRRASEKHKYSNIRFLAADVRRLPFPDELFSVVVSPSTLDHFPDPSDLGVSLRELYRVLEPGGRLVITLDNRQNLFDPLLRLAHRLGMVPFFMGKSYSVGELSDELRDAGFEVRETTAILHNPRLVAVATMRVVRWLRWRRLIRWVESLMLAAQRLEHTRLCYLTGSFVAALAVRPERDTAADPGG